MRGLNYDLLDDEWSAAWTQRHSLSINGGTEKATYFAGASYYNQEGNMGRLVMIVGTSVRVLMLISVSGLKPPYSSQVTWVNRITHVTVSPVVGQC